jgi:hypothetical protein
MPCRTSHLAWHHRFRDELWDNSYWWTNLIGLDALNRKVVAGWLHAFAKNAPVVGYGFSFSGCKIENDSMGQPRYRPGDPGKGLTCATYIVFVLDQLGFELLRQSEWPNRPEDRAWQKAIVDLLKSTGVMTLEELQTVEADVGCVRFKPIEVTAAATQPIIPVSFADAQAIASQIMGSCAAALS